MHSCSECMNKECQSRGNISGRGHCDHFIAPQNVVKEEFKEVVFARKTNDSLRDEIKELEKQNEELLKCVMAYFKIIQTINLGNDNCLESVELFRDVEIATGKSYYEILNIIEKQS